MLLSAQCLKHVNENSGDFVKQLTTDFEESIADKIKLKRLKYRFYSDKSAWKPHGLIPQDLTIHVFIIYTAKPHKGTTSIFRPPHYRS